MEREKLRSEERAILEKQFQLKQAEADFYRQRAQKLETQRPLSSAQAAFTTENLRTLLDVPSERDARDLEQVSEIGKNAPSSSHTKSYWLLEHSAFRAWLNSNESHSLVIDENEPSLERISSTSFVCATLIQGLKETQQATAIAFFCGLHTGKSALLRGPQGLMRSLIHQLLPVQDFDVGFVNDGYAKEVESHNVMWLCDLFVRLIDQLNEGSVLFCVIDCVAAFEKQKYGNGIFLVVEKLAMLTRTLGSAPVFKFLLTSPKVSKQMRNRFSSDDCIVLRKGSEDGRVFTGNYLNRQTRRLFDAQEESPGASPQDGQAPEDDHEEGLSLLPDIKGDSDEED